MVNPEPRNCPEFWLSRCNICVAVLRSLNKTVALDCSVLRQDVPGRIRAHALGTGGSSAQIREKIAYVDDTKSEPACEPFSPLAASYHVISLDSRYITRSPMEGVLQ